MRIALLVLLALPAPAAAVQGRPERARDMGIALEAPPVRSTPSPTSPG